MSSQVQLSPTCVGSKLGWAQVGQRQIKSDFAKLN